MKIVGAAFVVVVALFPSALAAQSPQTDAIPKFVAPSGTLGNSTIVDVNGNVGIGTSTPSNTLHVNGDITVGGGAWFGPNGGNLKFYGYHPVGALNIDGVAAYPHGGFLAHFSRGNGTGGRNFYIGRTEDATNFISEMTFDINGRVGIGTSTPMSKLEVNGDVATLGGGWLGPGGGNLKYYGYQPVGGLTIDGVANTAHGGFLVHYSRGNGAGGRNFYIGRTEDAATFTSEMMFDTNGRVGIGTNSPISKLHVAGDVRVDGNIAAKYQDVAEWVDSSEPLTPGTLVVIDDAGVNRVMATVEPYDSRVVGAVSAQPGIVLGEPGSGKVLVAQSGRVRIKADARYGAIRAGDLLVTSPTRGAAMRSEPIEVGGAKIHRPGTLVGKALEPLEGGVGDILVVLTLQ